MFQLSTAYNRVHATHRIGDSLFTLIRQCPFPDLIPDYFQPWSQPLLIRRNKVLITHMVISLSPPYHCILTIPCFSATKFAALRNVLFLLQFYILCRIFLQERTRCHNIWTLQIPLFMGHMKRTMFDGVPLTSMSAWTGKCPTLKTTSNKAKSLTLKTLYFWPVHAK